jgi:hypothetical protein
MLISPLELEFLCRALGISVPSDPGELAQMLPELYYLSQNIHRAPALPPGYASLAATNTGATRDLNRPYIQDLPSSYGNLSTPSTINPEVAALAKALNRTMQVNSIHGSRPHDETQIDRDEAANSRAIEQGEHFASAAPVAFDLPSYSPNGAGYSLLNTLHNTTVPPSVRYGWGSGF